MKTTIPTKWPLNRKFPASKVGLGMWETRKATNLILGGSICLNGNPISSREQGQSMKQGNGKKCPKCMGWTVIWSPVGTSWLKALPVHHDSPLYFGARKRWDVSFSVSLVHREYPNTPPISHFPLFFPVTYSKNTCEFPFQVMTHRLYMG